MEVKSLLMNEKDHKGISAALGRIPAGLYILTAGGVDRRTGMLCSWVQQLGIDPPMVSVAIAKSRPIVSLIRESGHFGLCQLSKDDKQVLGRFAAGTTIDVDPFDGLDLQPNETGVPILQSTMASLECELVECIDLEADHYLFVGKVLAGQANDNQPVIRLRENGFRY